MAKITITYAIVITSIFLLGCNRSSITNEPTFDKPFPVLESASGRIYDCAANSLYFLCQMSNIKISYPECLNLLPFRREGNSMLEFKLALMSLGFKVEAQRINVDELYQIRNPAVILIIPQENLELLKTQTFGHYFVLWPLDDKTLRIFDYPNEPVILSTEFWISHLHTIGVKEMPVLLCSKQDQKP